MERFGPDPRQFFEDVYEQPAPWDVGQVQPALTSLVDAYPPTGPVLDAGCGTGDTAVALATRGLDVVGVDFAERAIALARERAAGVAPDVAARLGFRVGDALRPSTLGRRFGAIVDSGFFHLFDQPTRDSFAGDLADALTDGGRYYLLGFAVEFPVPKTPLRVTDEELHSRFTPQRGWRTLALQPAEFLSRLGPVPAIAACFERLLPQPGARGARLAVGALLIALMTAAPATAQERIVGLPCEGCEAVFQGLPASLTSTARITPPDAPGTPMTITGRVLAPDGTPRAGVVVYAYQTDASGVYPRPTRPVGQAGDRHGALRAWVVSDTDGRYTFQSIRPGSYPSRDTPEHVHMHVIERGCATYYIDDVMFTDDPLLTPAARAAHVAARAGSGVVTPSPTAAGWLVTRDIRLGVNIPGYPGCTGGAH